MRAFLRLEAKKLTARSPQERTIALERVKEQQEPYTEEQIELIAGSPDVSAIARKVMVTTAVDVLRWVHGSPSSGFAEAMDTLEAEQRHIRH